MAGGLAGGDIVEHNDLALRWPLYAPAAKRHIRLRPMPQLMDLTATLPDDPRFKPGEKVRAKAR